MDKNLIILQGNIAAGKSTLLKSLDSNKYEIIDENMELFTNFKTFNPLDLFYKKEISSFTFNTYLFTIYMDLIKTKLSNKKINILCRSPIDSFKVFSQTSESTNSFEYFVGLELVKTFLLSLDDYKINIVYLDVSPEICINRLKNRNRNEECTVDLEYLQKLDTSYKKSLLENDINFVKIDGEDNVDNIILSFENELSKIIN